MMSRSRRNDTNQATWSKCCSRRKYDTLSKVGVKQFFEADFEVRRSNKEP